MPKSTGKNYGSTKKRAKVTASAVNGTKEKQMSRRRHQDGQLIETEHGWSMRYYLQGEGRRKRTQRFLGTFAQLTKPQAKSKMAEALVELNNNPVVHPQTTTQTFAQYAERWIAECETRKRKPIKAAVLSGWRSILKNHLSDYLGPLPLSHVDSLKMGELVNRLTRKKLKPTTIQNILLVAKLVKRSARGADQKRLFTETWDAELIDAPTVNEHEQRRPRFTAEQVSDIVKTATGRIQMICILAASSGLRIGELLGLEVRHFSGASVKIEQSIWNARPYPPKTPAARRTVDLHPDVAKLLREYVGTRTSGYIFRARTGKPLRTTNILRREFHPVLEQLKIPLCGFHSFRRFRVTHLGQSRCPYALLIFWVGHAKKAVTDLYDRSAEDLDYRKTVSQAVGVGFELPTALTLRRSKEEKISQVGVNAQLVPEETAINVG